jgi:hypothetical protein
MPVPNSSFGTATAAIPLSQLDANFATPITLGNTAIQLGNTVTTLNNMTLANVTISSGTITITNVSVTTANVSGTANISTLVVVGNETVGGNTTITGNITAANSNVTTNLVLSGGTANGVAYLNTSKQLTTGTALVFDGTSFGVGQATPNIIGFSRAITINNATGSVASEYAIGGSTQGWFGSSAAQTQLGSITNIPVVFYTNNTERARIDSSGNLGLGVTPSAWRSTFKALQITGTATVSSNANTAAYFGSNWYTDSGGIDKYIANGQASIYGMSSGSHIWYSAASGTAGNAITFTQAMTLDTSGNLGIGATSPAGKVSILQSASATPALITDVTNAVGSIWHRYTTASSVNQYMDIVLRSGNEIEFNTNSKDISLINNTTFVFKTNGRFGIGTASPNYKLEVSTDSAGKPGVGGLWTVVSDERIKSNIVPANLDRCYEIVKSVPLKHFGFAPGVYTEDQIQDKHNLGWIAQDVQKVFKNAVSIKPFTLKTDIPDGTEEYEEQDFTLETVEKKETSIQVINGKPVQVLKVVTSENKVMLFDTVDVLDEAGDAVMDGDKPVTYQMPRMVTKTRPKFRRDVIEDCLDLNGGQMIAALYGCVQALMAKVEALEAK